MAVRIVDLLEMVDVDQQERHRLFGAVLVLQQLARFARHRAARQHPGQKIVVGAVLQTPHQLAVGGDRTGEDQRPHHQHGDAQRADISVSRKALWLFGVSYSTRLAEILLISVMPVNSVSNVTGNSW